MKPSIDKLHKFFKLEIKSGYENRAVMGGLQKMPGTWENDARADELPENLIRTVHAHLRDYHQLTVKSRAEVLVELWAKIQKILGDPLPDLGISVPAPEPPRRRASPPVEPAPAKALPPAPQQERSKPAPPPRPETPPKAERPAPRPRPVEERPPAPVPPRPVYHFPFGR